MQTHLIAFIIACIVVLYGCCYWLQEKNKAGLGLALLLCLSLALRCVVACDGVLHEWDERYHALVSKNMAAHPLKPTLYDQPVLAYDYTNWPANHVWLHKQPMALWCMAWSQKIMGSNEWAVRVPSILFSTLAVYFTYIILLYLSNRRVAFMGAMLLSINGWVVEVTAGRVATDHVDVCFFFFITLGMFFAVQHVRSGRWWYLPLIGIAIGCAILSKWVPALIVLPVWLLLAWDSQRWRWQTLWWQGAIIVVVAAAVALPWQMYILRNFPLEAAWEYDYNQRHFSELLEGRGGEWYMYLTCLRVNYGDLIYVPLIWFGYQTLRQRTDLKRWAVCVWIALPLLIFSMAQSKMGGYILFVCPALFFVSAEFLEFLRTKFSGTKWKWSAAAFTIVFFGLAVRYSIERIKPSTLFAPAPEWVTTLKTLHKEGNDHGIIFNCKHPIETMFYTDFIAYEEMPKTSVMDSLRAEGWRVMVDS